MRPKIRDYKIKLHLNEELIAECILTNNAFYKLNINYDIKTVKLIGSNIDFSDKFGQGYRIYFIDEITAESFYKKVFKKWP